MSVALVLDAFAEVLTPAAVPATVDTVSPVDAVDLPHVTMAFTNLTSPVPYRVPGVHPRRGILPVEAEIDLADPRLVFPDGDEVTLVTPDRSTVHLPHGPAVAADGTSVPTLTAADLTVTVDGVPRTVVASAPGPGEVRCLAHEGRLESGEPLPPTGTLELAYAIGEWTAEQFRAAGLLELDVAAADVATVDTVSRAVLEVLADLTPQTRAGLRLIQAVEVGPIVPLTAVAGARTRRLVQAFDLEVERADLGSGGGVISRVDVDTVLEPSLPDLLPVVEEFEVPV